MKSLALLILLLSFSLAIQAQYNPAKVNKKAVQLYQKAMGLAQTDELQASIETLKQAVRIDSTYEEAWLSIAGMYGSFKSYQAAVDNYEKAKAIDSNFFIDYNLPYSIDLAGIG